MAEDPTRKMVIINLVEAEVTKSEKGNLQIYIIKSHDAAGLRLAKHVKRLSQQYANHIHLFNYVQFRDENGKYGFRAISDTQL